MHLESGRGRTPVAPRAHALHHAVYRAQSIAVPVVGTRAWGLKVGGPANPQRSVTQCQPGPMQRDEASDSDGGYAPQAWAERNPMLGDAVSASEHGLEGRWSIRFPIFEPHRHSLLTQTVRA